MRQSYWIVQLNVEGEPIGFRAVITADEILGDVNFKYDLGEWSDDEDVLAEFAFTPKQACELGEALIAAAAAANKTVTP